MKPRSQVASVTFLWHTQSKWPGFCHVLFTSKDSLNWRMKSDNFSCTRTPFFGKTLKTCVAMCLQHNTDLFWVWHSDSQIRSEIWTGTLTTKRCTIPSVSLGTSSPARPATNQGTARRGSRESRWMQRMISLSPYGPQNHADGCDYS